LVYFFHATYAEVEISSLFVMHCGLGVIVWWHTQNLHLQISSPWWYHKKLRNIRMMKEENETNLNLQNALNVSLQLSITKTNIQEIKNLSMTP
jgi:hypothetical protein